MVWCVNYSSLEAVDWSLYKFGGEGDKKGTALKKLGQKNIYYKSKVAAIKWLQWCW